MSSKLVYSTRPAVSPLEGTVRVPGDKSMSHRAVMFSSLATGVSKITGLLEGEDVLATLNAFRAMGVTADGPSNGRLTITGAGMRGLQPPEADLDMGNSGTAMRLLSGILAAQHFASKLVGDESLSARPMRRVTVPLTAMGARCVTDDNGCPPIHIRGVDKLEPIDYKLPMASAQIKSAVLLAGLYADGETSVTEPAPTRDHTERMLRAYGYPCETNKLNDLASAIKVRGGGELTAADIDVPADISSAAFFLVAASIVPGSSLTLKHVGVNPTRTGVIDVLREMGADIRFLNPRAVGGEPVADIKVNYVGLNGIDVDPKYVPLAIDELPVLCIAAVCAEGITRISGAEELRHKESDRISAMVAGLRALGIEVVENKDGLHITGGEFQGGEVDSFGDHRIAMSFAVAGAVSPAPVTIDNCDNVATSFPNFVALAEKVGMNIDV
ncbi:MAG: 3-phosphoshikimate 1-carboxyvinyltransferase [Gammaproteobacteria bacterium]|nr:3-phosphoshikimate 1-carboxyvinyltransferase [Gammaproteobacteria bacterium]